MPGGLWGKCTSCGKTIYTKEKEEKLHVCPNCGFHFTLNAMQRIALTLDEGTFEEHYAELRPEDRLEFVDKVPYSEKLAKAKEKTGMNEACVVGAGRIFGLQVVVGVLDFSFMGGSMGEVVGEKIARAVELAQERDLPVILFSASGGARMHEGVISLMQMAKTCAALSRFSEKGGFSISVMTNPTTGGVTASYASVCDVLIAEPGALIGFAGPRVIENTIRQELPEGFQRAEFLLEKGQIDLIASREQLREKLAQLLRYAPQYRRRA